MAYERLHWVESETPLSADNMNNIEDGIEELQSQKVDKVSGKALSDNNYTTAEKTKLAGIATGAEVNVQSDWNQSDSSADDFIKNKPGNASTSTAGLMSATDKSKLDGVQAGAQVNQDAFGTIKVGSTRLEADSPASTLTVSSGNHILMLPIASDNSVQIVTDIEDASNYTKGLMSASDKIKLDGIAAHANNFVLSRTTVTMSLTSATAFVPNSAAALTFSYQNLDAFTGIEFRDTSGNEVYGLAIVGFTITNNALRVLVRNVTSSNITLGTGTKAYAKKFS